MRSWKNTGCPSQKGSTGKGSIEGRVAEFLPDGRLRPIFSNGESQVLTTVNVTVIDDAPTSNKRLS